MSLNWSSRISETNALFTFFCGILLSYPKISILLNCIKLHTPYIFPTSPTETIQFWSTPSWLLVHMLIGLLASMLSAFLVLFPKTESRTTDGSGYTWTTTPKYAATFASIESCLHITHVCFIIQVLINSAHLATAPTLVALTLNCGAVSILTLLLQNSTPTNNLYGYYFTLLNVPVYLEIIKYLKFGLLLVK
jgi:hypothetical protein